MYLDEILRKNIKFADFSRRLFKSRLEISSGTDGKVIASDEVPNPDSVLEDEQVTPSNPLGVLRQTEAAREASRFVFEQDEHYGTLLDDVRQAVQRLGELLRTARFAQNLPEVSPLVVSYNEAVLTSRAQTTVKYALNWSFLFESKGGRPDRNSEALHKKLQINPMMSARWSLPIAVRGDLSLNSDLVNAIFDAEKADDFPRLLKALAEKWDHPLSFKRERRLVNATPLQQQLI